MKKRNRLAAKSYRLFGCHFIEEDFKYINKKLKKLKKKQEMSNSLILLELFEMYNKENKEK